MSKKTEIILDIIPIHINEIYPTRKGVYHYARAIDYTTNKDEIQSLKKAMIREIKHEFYFFDCIIVLEKGKVIDILAENRDFILRGN